MRLAVILAEAGIGVFPIVKIPSTLVFTGVGHPYFGAPEKAAGIMAESKALPGFAAPGTQSPPRGIPPWAGDLLRRHPYSHSIVAGGLEEMS
jgi:hypothetical protein